LADTSVESQVFRVRWFATEKDLEGVIARDRLDQASEFEDARF
jgi:hypothetical protein